MTDDVADIGILVPEVEVTVRCPESGKDVSVIVREFTFMQALNAQAVARPLIEAFASMQADDDDDVAGTAAMDEVIGNHAEIWVGLTAIATGLAADWIKRLDSSAAMSLSLAMWETNSNFFVQKALMQQATKVEGIALFRSLRRSTSSSGPATGQDQGRSANGTPGARLNGSSKSQESIAQNAQRS